MKRAGRKTCPFFFLKNFLVPFPLMEKEPKDQADFLSVTFFLIKKSPKNQADGKCSRTSPYPPTVGVAPSRINMARRRPITPLPHRMSALPSHASSWQESALWVCSPSGLQGLVEMNPWH